MQSLKLNEVAVIMQLVPSSLLAHNMQVPATGVFFTILRRIHLHTIYSIFIIPESNNVKIPLCRVAIITVNCLNMTVKTLQTNTRIPKPQHK